MQPEDVKRIRIAIALEQELYWYYRMLKGIELMGLTDQFMQEVEFWSTILRMNGARRVKGS